MREFKKKYPQFIKGQQWSKKGQQWFKKGQRESKKEIRRKGISYCWIAEITKK